MRAAVAGVDITPDRPLELEGYGDRAQPATGTLDSLEARALVLDDGRTRAALIALDLIGVTAATTARLRALVERQAGVPAENVVVVYSHTHAGPAMTQYVGSRADPAYVDHVERSAAAAVAAAAGQLRPVRIGAATGAVEFGVNRRRRTPDGLVLGPSPRGLIDRRVAVLRLDPADAPAPAGTLGQRLLPQADPVALLFSCVCHPTALRAENRRYSGDYPGAARRLIEAAYGPGEARAVFLPGCFGNVRPDLRAPDGRFRAATPHETTVLGRWLGAEVVGIAERIAADRDGSLAIGRREVSLPYARLPEPSELRAALESPRAAWARAMLDRITAEGRLPDAETTEVQLLRIGPHWIVALPGETTLEIGLAVERAFDELGLARGEDGESVVTVGYANDYVCYLCTASQYQEGGYEPESWAEYLRCGPFEPSVETRLVAAATELGRALGREGGSE